MNDTEVKNMDLEETKNTTALIQNEISSICKDDIPKMDETSAKNILIHSQIIIKPPSNQDLVSHEEVIQNKEKLSNEENQSINEKKGEITTVELEQQSRINQISDYVISAISETEDKDNTPCSMEEIKTKPAEDIVKNSVVCINERIKENKAEVIAVELEQQPRAKQSSDDVHIHPISETEEKNTAHCSKEEIRTNLAEDIVNDSVVCIDIKNTSLGFLQSQYSDSDSDLNSQSDSEMSEKDMVNDLDAKSSDSEPLVVNDQEYRNLVVEIESDSSSSDSDVELIHDDLRKKIIDFEANEENVEDDEENTENVKKRSDPLRVKGELLLHELPPIQDLQITVPEEECIELGKVNSIVDQLVLVDSIPGTVPLNLDTVLFLEKGQKVLGEIFDVLGQVTNPLYCVRFNSHKQIVEKGIEIGQIVYVAPRTDHTHFVILSEITRMRGSDASWKNDVEPSPRHMDFSDDEEERSYRRSLGNREHNDRSDEKTEERKRQRTFSMSSQMSESSTTTTTTTQSSCYNQNFRGRGRGRFSRPYRQQRQFQPRNQPVYNNAQLQNPPSYNYNQSNNTWHSNFNFNNPNYQSPNHRNRSDQHHRYNQHPDFMLYSMNNNYNQNLNIQEQNLSQGPNFNHNLTNVGASTIYPNPYAIRAPYISPNIMQQPLFPPPPPPPTSEN